MGCPNWRKVRNKMKQIDVDLSPPLNLTQVTFDLNMYDPDLNCPLLVGPYRHKAL